VSRLKSADSSPKAKASVFVASEFNHVAFDTPRREEAIAFYEKTFGMTNISHARTVRDTFLHFEKGFLNLGEVESAGLNHFCLGIENFDRDTAFRMLNLLDRLIGSCYFRFEELESIIHSWEYRLPICENSK